MRAAWLLVVLTGCDGVFGLIHIPDRTDAGRDGVVGDGRPDAAPCATIPFSNVSTFGTGASPDGIAIGDLNGDQHLDIVTANEGANTVSVMLGGGDGTFSARKDYAVDAGPIGVTIADLDGGGKPDIAAAAGGANAVSILLGIGDGSFAPVTTVGQIPGANDVIAFDYDTMPGPELAVANGDRIDVLFNDGNAQFPTRGYTTVGTGATDVHTADFNNDGQIDLVSANSTDSNISVRIRSVSGFGTIFDTSVPMAPRVAATGDLNADGLPEIAVVSSGGNAVQIVTNLDGRQFMLGQSPSVFGAPTGIAIGDLDLDGKPDLVVSNSQQGRITILLNDGSATFTPSSPINAGAGPGELAIADFDADARNDIAVVNRGSNNVQVYLGCPP